MNYIVAVSGGVDSMVLLDMLLRDTRSLLDHDRVDISQLIVAHVDHGIREESAEDARFVQAYSKLRGLRYEQTDLRLGGSASEEQAREARYAFLCELAKRHDAIIVTAHHRDDMIGSIAINLLRGTGWRGLAVLNRIGLFRPLLGLSKQDIYEYAAQNRLEWVEDATNSSQVYLRNRLRAGVVNLDEASSLKVAELRQLQIQLTREIDDEVARLERKFVNDRQPYTLVDAEVAMELLRRHVDKRTGYRPSIEQAQRLLLAIKTAKSGTAHDVASGVVARFGARSFVVDRPR